MNNEAYIEALKLHIWTLGKEISAKTELLDELKEELERFEAQETDIELPENLDEFISEPDDMSDMSDAEMYSDPELDGMAKESEAPEVK
jgi:hypothetical protein